MLNALQETRWNTSHRVIYRRRRIVFDHSVQFIYLSSFTRRALDVGFLDSRLYKTIHTLKQLSRSRVTLFNAMHLFWDHSIPNASSLWSIVCQFVRIGFSSSPRLRSISRFHSSLLVLVSSRPQLIFRSECISYFLSAAARSLLLTPSNVTPFPWR